MPKPRPVSALIWYGPPLTLATDDGELHYDIEIIGLYSSTDKAMKARENYREDYPTGELWVDDSYSVE